MSTSRHFTNRELACRHCGVNKVQPKELKMLERMRALLSQKAGKDVPVHINSAYRCPTHNVAVSSTGRRGPHTTGRAFDVRITIGPSGVDVLECAIKAGFTGIGVQAKGRGRFLHLDTLRKRLYSY